MFSSVVGVVGFPHFLYRTFIPIGFMAENPLHPLH
jgi:hypothetical protein